MGYGLINSSSNSPLTTSIIDVRSVTVVTGPLVNVKRMLEKSTSQNLSNDVLGRSRRAQIWYGVCLKLDVLDNSELLVVPPECVDLLFCYLHIK